MKATLKDNQMLYVRSMGKLLRITAIFTTDDDANAHSAQSNDAVMAVFGPFILMADKGDKGE